MRYYILELHGVGGISSYASMSLTLDLSNYVSILGVIIRIRGEWMVALALALEG